MKKINDLLLNAEDVVARIKSQAEQETAMSEVLPARFNLNIESFNKYIPDVANLFKDYKPTKKFKFFCTENGIPNLLWIDENIALYGENPFDECKDQIKNLLNDKDSINNMHFSKESNPLDFIHVNYMNKLMDKVNEISKCIPPISTVDRDVPLVLMLGVGLGYQVGYLYENCRPDLFLIIEPDLDIFYASLFTFDWYSLLNYLNSESLGVHFFIGQDDENVIQDVSSVINTNGPYLVSSNVLFWHYPSEKIFSLMSKIYREFFMCMRGWGFFDDSLIALSHSVENIKRSVPFLLVDKKISKKWQDIPVFIIGNGPSLDGALNFLKRHNDNVIIISCGSTLSALHKIGIKPDIHVQVERTKIVPDTHNLLNDENYLKDILFLSLDVIHPDCIDQFSRVGLAFKPFEPAINLLRKNYSLSEEYDVLSGANPLVGNTGIATACRLGFKNIYLFGIDNGYKDSDYHHSKLSLYFDALGKPKEHLSSLIRQKTNYLVPGNFGNMVETTEMMDQSRIIMERIIEHYNNVTVYNCSDGAKIKNTIPLKFDAITIASSVIIKNDLVEHIYNDLYHKIDIDHSSLEEKLNIVLFDTIIDSLVSGWSHYFSSKRQILTCMMHQYDYIKSICQGGNSHIFYFVNGSINYSFSVLLSTLYTFNESKNFYKYINELISIMCEYFFAMKNAYKNALHSVDHKEHGLLDL